MPDRFLRFVWNVLSLKKKSHNAPQKQGSIASHFVPFLEITSYFLKSLSWKKWLKTQLCKLVNSLPYLAIEAVTMRAASSL